MNHQCKKHGLTEHAMRPTKSKCKTKTYHYPVCRQCEVERVMEYRRRLKARLIAEFGGKCKICGYDKCDRAMEFHHIDPSQKSFSISTDMQACPSYERLRKEAEKCVLLCCRCHVEVEAGITKL